MSLPIIMDFPLGLSIFLYYRNFDNLSRKLFMFSYVVDQKLFAVLGNTHLYLNSTSELRTSSWAMSSNIPLMRASIPQDCILSQTIFLYHIISFCSLSLFRLIVLSTIVFYTHFNNLQRPIELRSLHPPSFSTSISLTKNTASQTG